MDEKRLSVGDSSSEVSQSTEQGQLQPVNLSGTNPLPHIYNVPNSELGISAVRRTTANDLPSKKLQFSQWHELRRTEVKGSQLKAPRVRKGPSDKDRQFYELEDEDNEKIHHDLHGRTRKKHQTHVEDWEHAQLASFTRQEMHHDYQRCSLDNILSRLKNVVYLNLQDNELLSLSSFTFPNCKYINLDNNNFSSLKQLPTLPKVQTLTVQVNDITDLAGLASLGRSPCLEEFYLALNPVAFKIGYRYRVFTVLQRLVLLDGVLRQEEDHVAPEGYQEDVEGSTCVIS